ncbi:MAG: SseB family protein [Candidatus Dormibacteraceae bacterium]
MNPLSELDQALAEAAYESRREADFRRMLPESDLYVLGEEGEEVALGRRELKLIHHTFGSMTYLSAYTSLNRLQMVAFGLPYLVVQGAAVFAAVSPGVHLALNLGGWPNRIFTDREAAELAAAWRESGSLK